MFFKKNIYKLYCKYAIQVLRFKCSQLIQRKGVTVNSGMIHHTRENFCFWLRAIAMGVLITFTSTTVVWGSPSLSLGSQTLGHELKATALAQRIEIPSELGSIKEVFTPQRDQAARAVPSASSTIIHLEDAHGSVEAQLHQEEILRHLQKQYGLNTIFVEGGLGDLNPELLRFFKDNAQNQKLIDKLTENGLVGGVERFLSSDGGWRRAEGVTADTPSVTKAYGVEEAALYRRELELFREVYAGKASSDEFLKASRQKLLAQSAASFNPELKTFFREWLFQAEVREDILSHLSFLQKYAEATLRLDLTNAREQYDWPMLVRFFKLKELEKLTGGRMEEGGGRELEQLLVWLKEKRLAEFVGFFQRFDAILHSLSSPQGEQDLRTFLEDFYSKAAPLGFKFDDYPVLSKRMGRMILSQEIQTEALLTEMEKLNAKILEALAKTPEERAGVAEYQEYLMLKKLFSLELTRGEYQQMLAQRATGNAQRGKLTSSALRVARCALRFYEIAKQREDAIFKNMLAKMKEIKQPNAVLITGGFHSEGLAEVMKAKGFSYVRMAPRISGPVDDSHYLRLMTSAQDHLQGESSGPRSHTSEVGLGRQTQTANARTPTPANPPEIVEKASPFIAGLYRQGLREAIQDTGAEPDLINPWLVPQENRSEMRREDSWINTVEWPQDPWENRAEALNAGKLSLEQVYSEIHEKIDHLEKLSEVVGNLEDQLSVWVEGSTTPRSWTNWFEHGLRNFFQSFQGAWELVGVYDLFTPKETRMIRDSLSQMEVILGEHQELSAAVQDDFKKHPKYLNADYSGKGTSPENRMTKIEQMIFFPHEVFIKSQNRARNRTIFCEAVRRMAASFSELQQFSKKEITRLEGEESLVRSESRAGDKRRGTLSRSEYASLKNQPGRLDVPQKLSPYFQRLMSALADKDRSTFLRALTNFGMMASRFGTGSLSGSAAAALGSIYERISAQTQTGRRPARDVKPRSEVRQDILSPARTRAGTKEVLAEMRELPKGIRKASKREIDRDRAAVVFTDVHGVILKPVWELQFAEAYRRIKKQDTIDEGRQWVRDHLEKDLASELARISGGTPESVRELLSQIADDTETVRHPQPVPEFVDFLQKCKGMGIPIVITSGSRLGAARVVEQLQKAGLQWLLDYGVFLGREEMEDYVLDDDYQKDTRDRAIREIRQDYFPGMSSLYFTDSEDGIAGTQAVGGYAFGVASAGNVRSQSEALAQAGADVVIEEMVAFGDLPGFLGMPRSMQGEFDHGFFYLRDKIPQLKENAARIREEIKKQEAGAKKYKKPSFVGTLDNVRTIRHSSLAADEFDPYFGWSISQGGSEYLRHARVHSYLLGHGPETMKQFFSSRIRRGAKVLDILAGSQTHLDPGYAQVTGVGLNAYELYSNPNLSAFLTQDLNADPELPLAWEGTFDAVIMSSGMAYLKDPAAVFKAASKALKPGGVLLVIYNDQYNQEVIPVWENLNSVDARLAYTQEAVEWSDGFIATTFQHFPGKITGVVARKNDEPFRAREAPVVVGTQHDTKLEIQPTSLSFIPSAHMGVSQGQLPFEVVHKRESPERGAFFFRNAQVLAGAVFYFLDHQNKVMKLEQFSFAKRIDGLEFENMALHLLRKAVEVSLKDPVTRGAVSVRLTGEKGDGAVPEFEKISSEILNRRKVSDSITEWRVSRENAEKLLKAADTILRGSLERRESRSEARAESRSNTVTPEEFRGTPYAKWAPWLRVFDIAISLLLLLPAMTVAMIVFGPLIKLESPGPIFFKQKRPGYKGRSFDVYKFRTMRITGSRVPTRLGAFLRQTAIDELPQVINILKGEMSFFGPRPLPEGEMKVYAEEDPELDYSTILDTRKPGYCSLFMIQRGFGKGMLLEDEFREAMQLNAFEVRNWSLVLMARIIVGTSGSMLKAVGRSLIELVRRVHKRFVLKDPKSESEELNKIVAAYESRGVRDIVHDLRRAFWIVKFAGRPDMTVPITWPLEKVEKILAEELKYSAPLASTSEREAVLDEMVALKEAGPEGLNDVGMEPDGSWFVSFESGETYRFVTPLRLVEPLVRYLIVLNKERIQMLAKTMAEDMARVQDLERTVESLKYRKFVAYVGKDINRRGMFTVVVWDGESQTSMEEIPAVPYDITVSDLEQRIETVLAKMPRFTGLDEAAIRSEMRGTHIPPTRWDMGATRPEISLSLVAPRTSRDSLEPRSEMRLGTPTADIFDDHKDAYLQIHQAIKDGLIPKDLALILFDYHSDNAASFGAGKGVEWLGCGNWITQLLADKDVGDIFWAYPTDGRQLLGKSSDFKEMHSDWRRLLLQNLSRLKKGVALSLDLDFFARISRDGEVGYLPEAGEIHRRISGIFAFFRENGIPVYLVSGAYSAPVYAPLSYKKEFQDAISEAVQTLPAPRSEARSPEFRLGKEFNQAQMKRMISELWDRGRVSFAGNDGDLFTLHYHTYKDQGLNLVALHGGRVRLVLSRGEDASTNMIGFADLKIADREGKKTAWMDTGFEMERGEDGRLVTVALWVDPLQRKAFRGTGSTLMQWACAVAKALGAQTLYCEQLLENLDVFHRSNGARLENYSYTNETPLTDDDPAEPTVYTGTRAVYDLSMSPRLDRFKIARMTTPEGRSEVRKIDPAITAMGDIPLGVHKEKGAFLAGIAGGAFDFFQRFFHVRPRVVFREAIRHGDMLQWLAEELPREVDLALIRSAILLHIDKHADISRLHPEPTSGNVVRQILEGKLVRAAWWAASDPQGWIKDATYSNSKLFGQILRFSEDFPPTDAPVILSIDLDAFASSVEPDDPAEMRARVDQVLEQIRKNHYRILGVFIASSIGVFNEEPQEPGYTRKKDVPFLLERIQKSLGKDYKLAPARSQRKAGSRSEVREKTARDFLRLIEKDFFVLSRKHGLLPKNDAADIRNVRCMLASEILAKSLERHFGLERGGKDPYRVEVVEGRYLGDNTKHYWLAVYLGSKEPSLLVDGSYGQFKALFEGKILVEAYEKGLEFLKLKEDRRIKEITGVYINPQHLLKAQRVFETLDRLSAKERVSKSRSETRSIVPDPFAGWQGFWGRHASSNRSEARFVTDNYEAIRSFVMPTGTIPAFVSRKHDEIFNWLKDLQARGVITKETTIINFDTHPDNSDLSLNIGSWMEWIRKEGVSLGRRIWVRAWGHTPSPTWKLIGLLPNELQRTFGGRENIYESVRDLLDRRESVKGPAVVSLDLDFLAIHFERAITLSELDARIDDFIKALFASGIEPVAFHISLSREFLAGIREHLSSPAYLNPPVETVILRKLEDAFRKEGMRFETAEPSAGLRSEMRSDKPVNSKEIREIDIEKLKQAIRDLKLLTCKANSTMLIYALKAMGEPAQLMGMFRPSEDEPFQYIVETAWWGEVDVSPYDWEDVEGDFRYGPVAPHAYEDTLSELEKLGHLAKMDKALREGVFLRRSESRGFEYTAEPFSAWGERVLSAPLTPNDKKVLAFLDATDDEKQAMAAAGDPALSRVRFTGVFNIAENRRPILSGQINDALDASPDLEKIEGEKARQLLQKIQLQHLDLAGTSTPYTFATVSLMKNGKPPAVYVSETPSLLPGHHLTRVIAVNGAEDAAAHLTEFYFVNGVYVGYGLTVIHATDFSKIDLLYQIFKDPGYGYGRRKIEGLSAEIYRARLRLLRGLVPEGQRIRVSVSKNQYQNVAEPSFYLRLGFKTVRPVSKNGTPDYKGGLFLDLRGTAGTFADELIAFSGSSAQNLLLPVPNAAPQKDLSTVPADHSVAKIDLALCAYDPSNSYFAEAVRYFNETMAGREITWEHIVRLYEKFRGDDKNSAYTQKVRDQRLASIGREEFVAFGRVLEWLNGKYPDRAKTIEIARRVWVRTVGFGPGDQLFVKHSVGDIYGSDGLAGFDKVAALTNPDGHPAEGHHRLGWFLMNHVLIRNGFEPVYLTKGELGAEGLYGTTKDPERIEELLNARVVKYEWMSSKFGHSAGSIETVPQAIVAEGRLGKVVDTRKLVLGTDQKRTLAKEIADLETEVIGDPAFGIKEYWEERLDKKQEVLLLLDPSGSLKGVIWAWTPRGAGFSKWHRLVVREDGVQGKAHFLADAYLSQIFRKGVEKVMGDVYDGGTGVETFLQTYLDRGLKERFLAGGIVFGRELFLRLKADPLGSSRSKDSYWYEREGASYSSVSSEPRSESREAETPVPDRDNVRFAKPIAEKADRIEGPGETIVSPLKLGTQVKFSKSEKQVAMDVAEQTLRSEKVGLFSDEAWRGFWTSLVPNAYADQVVDFGMQTLTHDVLEKAKDAPFKVSVTLTGKPSVNDPVIRLLSETLVKKPGIAVQIVAPGLSMDESRQFQQALTKQVMISRKGQGASAKGVKLFVTPEPAAVTEFTSGGEVRTLVYDMRVNVQAELESLALKIARGETLIVSDAVELNKKAYALLAAMDKLFDQQQLPRTVQSAAQLLSENLRIAAEAARSILRSA